MGSIQPPTWVPLNDRPLHTPRKIRAICIGAGYAGLLLAHRVKHEGAHKFIDLTVFEKNAGIGGTWYENSYPGAACDVPSHIYTFPFAPNPDWASLYVTAPEILKYMQDVTEKWRLLELVQLNTKVVSCIWSDHDGEWSVTVERDGQVTVHKAEVVVNGSGILNQPTLPDIPGLQSFKGPLVHSARWDHSVDFENKRVAVIGNGSSGIQIIPQIQRRAKTLVQYVRTPVWVIPNLLREFSPNGENFNYTEEQKQRFRDNPTELRDLRRKMEHAFNASFKLFFADSPQQKGAREAVTKYMKETLINNPELSERLIPTFALGCGRVNPGYGYLEALQEENARVEFNPIKSIDETGILSVHRREDGTEVEVKDEYDIIICATGFDVSFSPRWEMTGRDGIALKKIWAIEPEAYLGIWAPEMPNYFMFNGPNCPFGSGSLIGSMDATADYIVRFCKKIAQDDIKSACIKSDVVREFNDYTQEFMKGTVWAGRCRSWFKNHKVEGKITAMYAGSALHFRQMLEAQRWEDFEFSYRSPNRFRFMGNGMTQLELDGGPLGDYLMH